MVRLSPIKRFCLNFRLPIVDEKAPSEEDFDTILEVLRNEGPDTACVFNCQVAE
jgi:hypothetical protein